MQRALWILLLLPALAGCSGGLNMDRGNTSTSPAKGGCVPVCVGGGEVARFADYQAARNAFTRSSAGGILNATLEDVSWLRFEGDPDTVEKNHRAYFEFGYTTFQVILRARDYTRPTEESFILEDSRGARIEGKPISFRGGMKPIDDRWQFTFDVSFQHALGSECRWLRLTRLADGESVEWTFGAQSAR